jgi:lysozyme
MIKRHEGLRLCKYVCPTGHMTIGYGWNLDANKLPPDIASCLRMTGKITEEMAELLLDISIDAVFRQCRAIYKDFDKFSDNRKDALVDFVFNVGVAGALKFRKMREAIERGDWDTAADEMIDSLWYRQVNSRAKEIVKMIRNG